MLGFGRSAVGGSQALGELVDVPLQAFVGKVCLRLPTGVTADAVAKQYETGVGLFHGDEGSAQGKLEQLDQLEIVFLQPSELPQDAFVALAVELVRLRHSLPSARCAFVGVLPSYFSAMVG
jgi:hypothetical protein